jgi:hypothetical protein
VRRRRHDLCDGKAARFFRNGIGPDWRTGRRAVSGPHFRACNFRVHINFVLEKDVYVILRTDWLCILVL